MEWYSGSVMSDQDLSDRLPSTPEIWSTWRTYAPESFVSSNKCFDMDMNMIEEEFNFNDFCNQVETDTSVQDKDYSSGSSICGKSLAESMQSTSISCGQPGHELDHLAEIEQLDDIFLSSLIDDLPTSEDLHKFFGVLPANDLLTDKILDLRSNYGDKHSIGSSKYLQTHAFSPSVDCGDSKVAASTSIPCNSEQKDSLLQEAMMVELQVPSEENIANELMDEEMSMEESVMLEFQMAMSQLTDRTRICFRDALYRLAENSKHVTTSRQNADFTAETPTGTDHNLHTRSGKRKAMESETNIIDRAIANLMFNKMEENAQDIPVASTINHKQEVISAAGSPNDSSNHPYIHHFPRALVAGDAEVPMTDQKYQGKETQLCEDFSRVPAKNHV